MTKSDLWKVMAGAVAAGALVGCTHGPMTDIKGCVESSCKGQNGCKGKGGCKGDKNSCKGQNACKGQGGCAVTCDKSKEKSACKAKSGCGKNTCES